MPKTRTLIVGTGAIGGTVAGGLIRAGATEVVALSSNEAIAAAVEARGFRMRWRGDEHVARGTIVTSLAGVDGVFDHILLATPPEGVESAAREVAPKLAPGGAMVVLQNGLCEDRVAAALGADTMVLGAIVSFGASMPAPGVFEKTSPGGFTIGAMNAVPPARLDALSALLEPLGAIQRAENFAGARWSKLAINCAISSLGTLAGDRLGRAMRRRDVRRLALELMSEVVAVAHAEQVTLEKVSGTLDLDWIALTDAERHRGGLGLVAKHGVLLAMGMRFRNLRSSMLRALERGRVPPVDYINGEVVTRGAAHGVPTPVNRAAVELVHALGPSHPPAYARIDEFARRVGV